VLLSLLIAAAFAAPDTLSLAYAQRLAETHADAVALADVGTQLAATRVQQARSARLPIVSLQANTSLWTDAHPISFLPPGSIDCATLSAGMDALCNGLSTPITARNQVTGSASLRVVQPLTALFTARDTIDAADAGADAADANKQAVLEEARYQAADAWLLAAQADQQLDVVHGSIHALEARVVTAQFAYDAHALTRGDLLLVRLALATAQQTELQVSSLRDTSRARLGLAVGDAGARPAPSDEVMAPPRSAPDADALVARALASRDELKALRAQVVASEAASNAAHLARLPQVNAIGVATHSAGQGLFAEPNSAFVGATLDWTLFGGGRQRLGFEAAQRATDAARARLTAAESGVTVEVLARLDALRSAAGAYALAGQRVAVAEESLALVDTRHRAGTATMTELLDAEAALTGARSSQAAALYDAHRAEVALTRAVGDDPWAL